MPYIGNTIRAADDYRLIDDISSSFNGSTTSFALQVAGSAPVPFPKSPQQVLISVNGVIQEPDPTGASGFNLVGTNIVFSSAPTGGHAFFGIIYATADYLNAGGNFPSGSLGAPSLTFIGDENTGLYRKSGGSIGFVSDATEIANTDSNGITISSGNLILGDSAGASSDRVVLGASSDFSIYHDGTQSVIKNATGNLDIITGSTSIDLQGNDGSETLAKFQPNGAVELYFDNAKKAETVTGGFTVTGTLTATTLAGTLSTAAQTNVTSLGTLTGLTLSGDMTFTGDSANIVFDKSTDDLIFNDGAKAIFGTSSDGIEIYHASNESFIDDQGTGNLFIRSNGAGIHLKKHGTTETLAKFNTDGNNEFYFDNSKKAETVTGGFTVTGTCTATAFAGDGSALTGISAGVSVANQADNRLITATGTTDALNGESDLTFDGNTLTHTVGANTHRIQSVAAGDHYTTLEFNSNRSSAGNTLTSINFKWDNDTVCDILAVAGADTTNKDDGHLSFRTSPSQGSIAERLRITSAGNIGINTSSPTDKLHVVGTTNLAGNAYLTNAYVSGNIYLGGTGSANQFSDYEQGTWTPVGVNFTVANVYSAHYTKIGNVAFIQMYVQAAAGSGVSAVSVSGLPFTVKGSNYYSYAAGRIGGSASQGFDKVFQFNSGATNLTIFVADGNINEGMISGQHLIMSGFYHVA
tara:strand:+ start:167 stop:2248 length:2082 start_codon:yes stop_codon:yes gene_type:complete